MIYKREKMKLQDFNFSDSRTKLKMMKKDFMIRQKFFFKNKR